MARLNSNFSGNNNDEYVHEHLRECIGSVLYEHVRSATEEGAGCRRHQC